ncbi:MAG TPA: hypothetical protein VF780_05945 [Nitrosospira sp.]
MWQPDVGPVGDFQTIDHDRFQGDGRRAKIQRNLGRVKAHNAPAGGKPQFTGLGQPNGRLMLGGALEIGQSLGPAITDDNRFSLAPIQNRQQFIFPGAGDAP